MTIKNPQQSEIAIGKRLHEIVDACLEIDLTGASLASKRAKLENRQNEADERAKAQALAKAQAEKEAQAKEQAEREAHEKALAEQKAAAEEAQRLAEE